jgi:D-alanyl-D-alanine carboxypeptidase
MNGCLSAAPRAQSTRRRGCLYALLAVVACGATRTTAQSDGALLQRLDSIAGAAVVENRSVGVVAAVTRGNEPLLLRAYGKSDVEGSAPMTTDTVIQIGSTTKQFTAVSILRLRDEGKLSLDDEITNWLPDFDVRGNTVTLRHLLGHTSGVTELGQMPELRAMNLMRNPTVTLGQVYDIIRRQPFQVPTGTAQIYSNTNFWLVGLVVEKASGMTYEDFMEKTLLEPLGMSRSVYCNVSENVPRRLPATA